MLLIYSYLFNIKEIANPLHKIFFFKRRLIHFLHNLLNLFFIFFHNIFDSISICYIVIFDRDDKIPNVEEIFQT